MLKSVQLFRVFDSDKSGTISFQEIVTGLAQMCGASIHDRLRLLFRMYDTNDDGFVGHSELSSMLEGLHSLPFVIDGIGTEEGGGGSDAQGGGGGGGGGGSGAEGGSVVDVDVVEQMMDHIVRHAGQAPVDEQTKGGTTVRSGARRRCEEAMRLQRSSVLE